MAGDDEIFTDVKPGKIKEGSESVAGASRPSDLVRPTVGEPVTSEELERTCRICGKLSPSKYYRYKHERDEHPGVEIPKARRVAGAAGEKPVTPQPAAQLSAYPPEIQERFKELAARFYARLSSVPFRAMSALTGSQAWQLPEEEAKTLREDVELFCLAWGFLPSPKPMTALLVAEDLFSILPKRYRAYQEDKKRKEAERENRGEEESAGGKPFSR